MNPNHINTPEKEPSIKLKFEYNIDSEADRVGYFLGKADFFKENRYPFRLPNGLSIDDAVKLSEEERLEMITQEFDDSLYKKSEGDILGKWPETCQTFKDGLSQFGLSPDEVYKVELTAYGSGGSYNNGSRPKRMIINFMLMKDKVIRVICHEIVHLCIEDFIKKYKTPHWSKERIVDLIMTSIFSDERMQKIDPAKAEQIGEIFQNHSQNIEEVVRLVSIL